MLGGGEGGEIARRYSNEPKRLIGLSFLFNSE